MGNDTKSNKMTKYLSNKLRVLSFISIILVVYIHTYYSEGKSMSSLMKLESFWGNGICRVAVPLFFVISGYLFFLKCPDGIKSIWPKMKKRVRTLLVPYLLVNSFAIIFYVLMNVMVNYSPTINGVVNYHIFDEISQYGIWGSILALYWTDPVAFQLWFIRNLMVVILFAPIIYILLRVAIKGVSGFLLFLISEGLLLTVTITVCSDCLAAFWFVAGGYMAMNPRICISGTVERGYWATGSTFLFIALACMNVYHPLSLYQWLMPIVGIIALWTGYDLVYGRGIENPTLSPCLTFLCSYSFFVYLVHEPLLNILKKLPLLISRSEITLIVAYIIIPPIFYYLTSLIGSWIKHVMPRCYDVFTGGR